MSCGVGRRCSLDLALLWLWHGPAATAPIRPITWEFPCAVDAGLGKKKKKERKENSQLSLSTRYEHFKTKFTDEPYLLSTQVASLLTFELDLISL